MNGQDHQAANSPYFNVPQGQPPQPAQSSKRKGDEDSPAAGQRAKRNRYISIACNECKRRKIKCNGETPCQRCGNLSLECVYAPNCCSTGFKDSDEFRSMSAQIQSLQEQVNELYGQLNALRGGAPAPYSMQQLPPAGDTSSALYRNPMSPSQSRGNNPQFQGHTSNTYNFNVAKSSLQTMGISEPDAADEGVGNEIDPALGAPIQQQAPMAPMVTQIPKDPLWQLSRDEAIRLCKVYDEEMGIMYPLIDMGKMMEQARLLFSFTESAARTGLFRRDKPGMETMGGHDVNIIKMVLANALTIEENGQSHLGKSLYESCREQVENRLSGPIEIKGLILLVMVAEYQFQQDEEVQAYRIIGLAARLCLELGLHRRQTLFKTFTNEADRSWAIKLFWSIYVLDRRWSFGTGMPFALQDADIDSALPEPDPSNTYLSAMISYSRIASQVWRATSGFEESGNDIDKDKIRYLDYQISLWYDSIDESMRLNPSENFLDHGAFSRGQQRLRVILYMRKNQMRTHIYRPVLHSLTNIMENRDSAQTVVDVAKDTIRVLARLNEATDIYRTQQVVFNYFLIAALGVLFLAVAHAPNEFSDQVRDEFYQALDLVKNFSGRSYIAKRLWKTIRGLKEVAPKLGLVSRQTRLTDTDDPHSSAALAMAGLAGHAVDDMAAYASAANSSSLSSPMNGQQMSFELTNLFEAAGGVAGVGNPNQIMTDGANGYGQQAGQADTASAMAPGTEGFNGMYGSEGGISKIIGGLF